MWKKISIIFTSLTFVNLWLGEMKKSGHVFLSLLPAEIANKFIELLECLLSLTDAP